MAALPMQAIDLGNPLNVGFCVIIILGITQIAMIVVVMVHKWKHKRKLKKRD